MNPGNDLSVKGRCEAAAGERDAADDLWNILDLEGGVPRIDTLRGECQEEIVADSGSVLLEERQEQFLGGSGIGGALQDDQVPRADASGGFLGGGDHVGDVRVLGLPQWCGDADDDGVTLRQDRRLCDHAIAASTHEGLKLIARHVGNVGTSARKGRHPVDVSVEPGDREARFREFDGQREAYIPLTYDSDPRGVGLDAKAQRFGVIHLRLPPSHSTVTLLARFRGWSTSHPRSTPT